MYLILCLHIKPAGVEEKKAGYAPTAFLGILHSAFFCANKLNYEVT